MRPTRPKTPPGSSLWRVIHYPLTLLAIGLAMMALAGLLVGGLREVLPIGHGGLRGVLFSLIASAIFVGAYWLFVHFVERRPFEEFEREDWFGELAIAAAAGFVLFSIVIGIIATQDGYGIAGINPLRAALPALAVAIFSGVSEEIVLRGVIFRLVERLTGSWIALALSAILFGAMHLGNPNATLFAGLAIALEAGVMLAALYMVTRRLWAVIGLHAAWNFTQGGIYGVPVSGFDAGGLIRPSITGSDLLTGGSFGAEASLTALLVNLAVGIGLMWIAWQQDLVVPPRWVRRGGFQGDERLARTRR
ncbi:abortive infection protein [Sphingomonas sp. Leaf357]|uniref:CPBP family intramembrane glutamic endopeptidase n=1 Tax=Sphingomonas sp. Leaf357 TaxID=1736350 RepID=UPI0006F6D75D|nr:type II CAAX endopeptidase family protein [Sphingomonas sp. Leaf357]KQS04253.1 abortive infection protein [Sphingomonas sp. Leaf357]